MLWFPIKEVSVGEVKRYLGRKPRDGGLRCCFTAPLRLLSPSPFPALLFSLPRGTKRTWMQQPFWDSVLLNCADCEEVACKQERHGSIQSGLYSVFYSGPSFTPTHLHSIVHLHRGMMVAYFTITKYTTPIKKAQIHSRMKK